MDFFGRLSVTVHAESLRYLPALRVLARTFGAFRGGSTAGPASLEIRLGSFEPDLRLRHVVDDFFHVGEGRVYCAYSHKIARWRADVTGLEGAATVLRVEGNLASYLVFPFETIYQMILYKLGTQGLAFVHALGVARDGEARLVMGRSGIGKSLLGGKFLRDGWSLLGDDTVFVDAKGEIYGFPLPIGLRSLEGPLRDYGLKLTWGDHARYLFAKAVKLLTLGRIGLLFKVDALRLGQERLARHARLGAAVFAQPGETFSLANAAADGNLLDQVEACVRFEAVLLTKLLDAYAFIYPSSKPAVFWENQRKTLGGFLSSGPAFAARIPSRFSDDVYAGLRQGLNIG